MMSRLALGTVQFGLNYGVANTIGQVSRIDSLSILSMARKHKVMTIDTAIGYGDSELCLGEVGVKEFQVITKLPSIPEECADILGWVHEQVAASLHRLKIDRLHGLLLHNTSQLSGDKANGIIEALRLIKEAGLVEKVGVSIYNPEDLNYIFAIFKPDIVQAPLNLVDRRLVHSGWLKRLYDANVEIHTRSVFLQGLLLMERAPDYFARWPEIWKKWSDWRCESGNNSLISACLAYPLGFPEVSRVVIGVDGPHQFAEILAGSLSLPELKCLPSIHCNDESLINPSNWRISK